MPNGPTLTLIDVDFTLFQTFAKVLVVANGEVRKSLSSIEYNTYVKAADETYDYCEFKSAEVFRKTSIPIPTMIAEANRLAADVQHEKDKFVIITARGSFDSFETFKATFEDHNINVAKAHFTFSGDLFIQLTWKAKQTASRIHLYQNKYALARMYDDSMDNLNGFLDLQRDVPETKLEAFFVDPKTGEISPYTKS